MFVLGVCGEGGGGGGGEHNVYCAKFKAIVPYNDNLIINNMYRQNTQ